MLSLKLQPPSAVAVSHVMMNGLHLAAQVRVPVRSKSNDAVVVLAFRNLQFRFQYF
jgi:hypothetical protein